MSHCKWRCIFVHERLFENNGKRAHVSDWKGLIQISVLFLFSWTGSEAPGKELSVWHLQSKCCVWIGTSGIGSMCSSWRIDPGMYACRYVGLLRSSLIWGCYKHAHVCLSAYAFQWNALFWITHTCACNSQGKTSSGFHLDTTYTRDHFQNN